MAETIERTYNGILVKGALSEGLTVSRFLSAIVSGKRYFPDFMQLGAKDNLLFYIIRHFHFFAYMLGDDVLPSRPDRLLREA